MVHFRSMSQRLLPPERDQVVLEFLYKLSLYSGRRVHKSTVGYLYGLFVPIAGISTKGLRALIVIDGTGEIPGTLGP